MPTIGVWSGVIPPPVVEGRDGVHVLCETCGYDIEGLPDSATCSECGRPVTESRPERRVGSPYQKNPSSGFYLATGVATLLYPVRVFNRVRIERDSSQRLLLSHIFVASVLLSVGPWLDLGRLFLDSPLLAWPLNFLISFVGLFGLTKIESLGIRTFGARHRWRVTPDVALTVTAHAAVGWVLGGVLFLLAVLFPLPAWYITLPRGPLGFAFNAAAVIPAVLALAAGLIVFELLVYVGVRRCRFANPPRSPVPTA